MSISTVVNKAINEFSPDLSPDKSALVEMHYNLEDPFVCSNFLLLTQAIEKNCSLHLLVPQYLFREIIRLYFCLLAAKYAIPAEDELDSIPIGSGGENIVVCRIEGGRDVYCRLERRITDNGLEFRFWRRAGRNLRANPCQRWRTIEDVRRYIVKRITLEQFSENGRRYTILDKNLSHNYFPEPEPEPEPDEGEGSQNVRDLDRIIIIVTKSRSSFGEYLSDFSHAFPVGQVRNNGEVKSVVASDQDVGLPPKVFIVTNSFSYDGNSSSIETVVRMHPESRFTILSEKDLQIKGLWIGERVDLIVQIENCEDMVEYSRRQLVNANEEVMRINWSWDPWTLAELGYSDKFLDLLSGYTKENLNPKTVHLMGDMGYGLEKYDDLLIELSDRMEEIFSEKNANDNLLKNVCLLYRETIKISPDSRKIEMFSERCARNDKSFDWSRFLSFSTDRPKQKLLKIIGGVSRETTIVDCIPRRSASSQMKQYIARMNRERLVVLSTAEYYILVKNLETIEKYFCSGPFSLEKRAKVLGIDLEKVQEAQDYSETIPDELDVWIANWERRSREKIISDHGGNGRTKVDSSISLGSSGMIYATSRYRIAVEDIDEADNIVNKKVSDLNVHDRVIVPTGNNRDIFEYIVDKLSEQYSSDHELAFRWHALFKGYCDEYCKNGHAKNQLYDHLKKKGFSVSTPQSFRDWMNGEVLFPANIKDVIKIGELVNSKEIIDNAVKMKKAAEKLNNLHREIGRYIARRIRNALAAGETALEFEGVKFNDITDRFIEAEVLEITKFPDGGCYVPAGLTNRLLTMETLYENDT